MQLTQPFFSFRSQNPDAEAGAGGQLPGHPGDQAGGDTKACCGVVVSQTVSIRWFIVMIAFVGICCAVVGTVLGAMKASGREHLTVSLLMIGQYPAQLSQYRGRSQRTHESLVKSVLTVLTPLLSTIMIFLLPS